MDNSSTQSFQDTLEIPFQLSKRPVRIFHIPQFEPVDKHHRLRELELRKDRFQHRVAKHHSKI